MGLLQYQAMPSLRDVAHGGVLYTFSNRSAPDRDESGPSGQEAWIAHHVQNRTLLGQSPLASSKYNFLYLFKTDSVNTSRKGK
jgi:hypothetical protein